MQWCDWEKSTKTKKQIELEMLTFDWMYRDSIEYQGSAGLLEVLSDAPTEIYNTSFVKVLARTVNI